MASQIRPIGIHSSDPTGIKLQTNVLICDLSPAFQGDQRTASLERDRLS